MTLFTTRPRLRIGMVLDQPFPPDARVEREAAALAEAGYEVHLLCSASSDRLADAPDELADEAYRGFYVHRVDPAVLRGLKYHGIYKNAVWRLRAIDTVWHVLIARFAERYHLHVLHIHDLRLVASGLDVARQRRIPLVADLHENYPALMQMLKGRDNPRRGVRQRRRWEAIETDCAQRADRVITVIDEARERLMRKAIAPGKIMVLPNTVDVDKFNAAALDSNVIRAFKSAFLLTYVGHLNESHRGIQTVLEAMALLKDEIPELQFVAAGAYREPYRERLDALIEQFDLAERVHFTGWLDETEFASYIEASDICLCPHLKNDHTDHTFPNKVYLYHLFRKPIIASNCTPMARYLEETQGGLVFESDDARDLAAQIYRLYTDGALRRQLGQSGQQAVLQQHNWGQTARRLVALYDDLVRERLSAVTEEAVFPDAAHLAMWGAP